MTIEEVEYRTPNGLHDSYLLGLVVDYEVSTLRLELSLLVGLPDGKTHEEREGYRRGSLLIDGMHYCVVEAPDKGKQGSAASRIDGFRTRPEDIQRCHLPVVLEPAFRYSLFVVEWNSFVHFAENAAEIFPADLLVREMGA